MASRNYKISSTLALIFAFPLAGRARIPSHPRHFTFVDAFPNMICEFLHFEHFTLINLVSDMFFTIILGVLVGF